MIPLYAQAKTFVASQVVNPSQGSAKAAKGAVERLSEPDLLDIISPFFAFTIVILLPSFVALWVIGKIITQKPVSISSPPVNEDITSQQEQKDEA